MYNLKVKTKQGPSLPLAGRVNGDSTLQELRLALCELTSIATNRQKILSGFPPQQIKGSGEDTLKSIGLKNGEVIIVEEIPLSMNIGYSTRDDHQSSLRESSEINFPKGTLLKKVVPSDNSCLFTSVYYLINGGSIEEDKVSSMREIVALSICRQPDIYNEAILEKSNPDYCRWILKETSWGGAIELSIFCDYYETEIVALDAKAGVMNRFGEDKKYDQRIFLMYDGIHYDPIYLETYDGRQFYRFPSNEIWLLEQAQAMVQEARNAGQFTDTRKFNLVCSQCGFVIRGENEALFHAQATGHSEFQEMKKNL